MLVWYEYLIVAAYLVVILAIGAYFSRKGSSSMNEYFLGGQSLPWWVLGISFMTSNLDLTGTMVIASFFAMVGLKGFLVELRGGTCLPLALFMVFMAKWHRRSGVMTMAEWMEFRFGDNAGSRAARLTSAVGVVILVIGMSTYFSVGFGKFLSLYFPFSPNVCAIIFTSIATVHILASGLYGVAFTDVLQGAMILLTVVIISWLAFALEINPEDLQAAWAVLGAPQMTWDQWTSILPQWTMDFPAGYQAYNQFGVLLGFWTLRIFLEGFGGPLIPYASQRFFAAKDDREASLTTCSSLTLFVVRWPLIISVALLGLSLGGDIPTDPEMVFPAVVAHYFPVGLRAVIVSCLVAAAMSTFDSTINAGGAYIVNDLYHRFINPRASDRRLMRLSMIATVGITVACLLLANTVTSINAIWSWLSMGFFGGLAVPLILRWYWARFNGWGYTAGTVAGIFTAVAQSFIFPGLAEHYQLGGVIMISLPVSVLATLLTPPVEAATTLSFYRKTRPMGLWAEARGQMGASELIPINKENRRDIFCALAALVGFFFLFLGPMYVIIHEYMLSILSLSLTAGCAALLYKYWYRNL